ncbi:MAG TPA: NTPase [Nitrospiraceae bacterium]|jgi:nucleoside-triphosphatase|nr:NTPase [Nitrospiraceae bacterium]
MKHLLITGRPGVGKTTLIRTIVRQLRDVQPAGFYTEEIRAQGVRKGFRLITLDGRQQVLSHIDLRGPCRVSRYGVDVAGFERLLEQLDLRHVSSPVIIIDEIGKMECFSTRFKEEVLALLDSSKIVIATIALKGNEFIERIKQRNDCRLVMVTEGNRDQLAGTLAAEVLHALKGKKEVGQG